VIRNFHFIMVIDTLSISLCNKKYAKIHPLLAHFVTNCEIPQTLTFLYKIILLTINKLIMHFGYLTLGPFGHSDI